MKKIFLLIVLASLYSIHSFSKSIMNDSIVLVKVQTIIGQTKELYSPKSGEVLFKISALPKNDTIFVAGATTEEEAYNKIKNDLELANLAATVVNNVKLLPNTEILRDTLYGVINVSVADIRTQNRYTSGMATQAMLGTPVRILDKDNWFLIQMPDSYYGWAHGRQIVPMDKKTYNEWLSAPQIIYTKHYGFSYLKPDKEGETVSDLVSGNVLQLVGVEGEYFKVAYPDKRIAYVLRSESQDYATWLNTRQPTAENFLKVANSLKGIPYVWGGTSAKGVDCSGLISTVMKLHGLLILRDASQQATIGLPIDISTGYENLKPGDLMFFGKDEDSIRHVGFYLGDNQFLHASDYTRVGSLNPKDKNYDKLNTSEFIKASRIVDQNGLHGVEKIVNNDFYQIQK